MCSFIKSNGEHCKLATKNDAASIQLISIMRKLLSNAFISQYPNRNTPIVAEVVDTSAPSVIEPVETSNIKISKVPELDESIVAPVIADSAIYGKEYNSNSGEINNSDTQDEDTFFYENYIEPELFIQYDVRDEMKQHPLGIRATIDAINEYIYDNNLEVEPSIKPNRVAHEHGYRYCYYIQQDDKTFIHYYFKTQKNTLVFPELIITVDAIIHCVKHNKYGEILFGLCSALPKTWFQNWTNLWMLAGFMATKSHVDIHQVTRTYFCVLKTKLKYLDINSAIAEFKTYYLKGEPIQGT
ncbi:Hypothetical protein PHPALM_38071 [Phytophthora palmivora]|uniref:Uncharacterized protein n=1 Tax=Phytophthora palmivora TaxID=4796 RepID=A0A2P4WVU4_9STRA|nr:Hypothetical protein PHPALM_38071 [Phytophthora palmivora]